MRIMDIPDHAILREKVVLSDNFGVSLSFVLCNQTNFERLYLIHTILFTKHMKLLHVPDVNQF